MKAALTPRSRQTCPSLCSLRCLPLPGHCLQQYILANAAVSRSFSAYFAALIGKPTDFFT